MPSVLFICTANQFRSPIAAACLLKNMEQENTHRKWIVESAGTWTRAGLPAPDIALQIANQLGLNGLDGHLTRQIDKKLLNEFDLIIVMENGHKEAICTEFPSVCDRLYLLSEVVDSSLYDISDPADPNINPKDVGGEIHMLITRGKGKILQLAESLGKTQSPEQEDLSPLDCYSDSTKSSFLRHLK
jgi:protein-tyrosine-phosphatase